MKKKTLLVLVVMLTLSVVLFANGQKENTLPQEEVTELNFWTWDPSADAYARVLDKFEEQTGIHVNNFVITNIDYQKKLPLALVSGEDIDVVGVQTNMANEITPFLTNIEPMMDETYPDWKSNYSAQSLVQCKFLSEEGIQILNQGSQADWVIFYNADMIKELGLEVPTTYAEWKTFNQTIRDKKPEVVPFGFYGGNSNYYQTASVLSGQTSDIQNDIRFNGAKWTSPEYVVGIQAEMDMFKDGIITYQEVGDMTRARALELFAAGKVASYMDGSWGASVLSSDYRKANGYSMDVGAFAFPVEDPNGQISVRSYINNTVGIVKNSKKQAAALKLVHFLACAEGSTMLADSLNWFTPVSSYETNTAVFTTEASRAGYQRIIDAIAISQVDRNNPNAFPEKASAILGTYIMKGNYDAQSAAEDMQKEWDTGMYE
jgi:raffinose/stachyose/melibiose transport system substrate-binding protein